MEPSAVSLSPSNTTHGTASLSTYLPLRAIPTPTGRPCPRDPVATSTRQTRGTVIFGALQGLRVSFETGAELPQRHQLLVGDDPRCHVHRVEQLAGMPLGEDQPVVFGCWMVPVVLMYLARAPPSDRRPTWRTSGADLAAVVHRSCRP